MMQIRTWTTRIVAALTAERQTSRALLITERVYAVINVFVIVNPTRLQGHQSHSIVKAFVRLHYQSRIRMTRKRVKQEAMGHVNGFDGESIDLPERMATSSPPTGQAAVEIGRIDTDFTDGPIFPSGDTLPEDEMEIAGSHSERLFFPSRNEVDQVNSPLSDALESLGRNSRKLIEVIAKLEALNIDSTLPSLPKFVVVGDQSHGKSSIIEAICDIDLPRKAGTCTRCPFSITTTASAEDQWTCKISLIRKNYFVERQDGKNWPPLPEPEITHFATLNNKDELDMMLRLAQIAVLSPNVEPAHIRDARDVHAETEHTFSPNLVSLEIAAPNLPEISLVDLPGAINATAEDEDQHLVKFIERLIEHYIDDDKALILLAVSADQDTQNSTSFRYVRSNGALDRCMGVLTKPDLLVRQKIPEILRLLEGRDFKLGNKWFVAKNTSTEDKTQVARISHADARALEQDFFSKAPWSTNLADFADRFGIAKIQATISQKLTAHIVSELPMIIQRVQVRLDEVVSDLRNFPGQPANPSQTVLEGARAVERMIAAHLAGHAHDGKFRSFFKDIMREYRTKLENARPKLILVTPGYVKPSIPIESEDENADKAARPPSTPAPKRAKGNAGQSVPQQRSTPRSKASRAAPKETFESRLTWRLEDVHREFDRASHSEFGNGADPKVIRRYTQQPLSSWTTITENLLHAVSRLICGMVEESMDESLANRKQTQLYSQIKFLANQFVTETMAEETKFINHLLECEQHVPTTYGGFELTERAVRRKLVGDRYNERATEHFDSEEARSNKDIRPEERQKKMANKEWMESALGSDPYGREVAEMATPLAYYDIASSRMLDVVGNHLEFGVLNQVERHVGAKLVLGLNVGDAEYCTKLLAEDAGRERHRLSLLALKRKLEQAMEALHSLPKDY